MYLRVTTRSFILQYNLAAAQTTYTNTYNDARRIFTILYVGLKDDLLLQIIAHWEISGIFQSYPYTLTYLFDSFLEF